MSGLSGYDWILNNCVDNDQAEHAAHLDDNTPSAECFHCREGEGGIVPPGHYSDYGITFHQGSRSECRVCPQPTDWMLRCDAPGCGVEYPIVEALRGSGGFGIRAAKAMARDDGWSCAEDSDFCPDHKPTDSDGAR